jgi:hypothetical protein
MDKIKWKKSSSVFEPITLRALTVRPLSSLYSAAELDRLGFCELHYLRYLLKFNITNHTIDPNQKPYRYVL